MGHISETAGGTPGTTDGKVNEVVIDLVAVELETIRVAIEDVAAALCSDIRIVVEHGEMMQSIDELAQRHENLARVLRARPMESAIDTITLETLRTRMLSGVTNKLASAAASNTEFWTEF